MNRRRAKFNRRFLYIFECQTPYGFPYRAYGNSLDDMPVDSTGSFAVNFKK